MGLWSFIQRYIRPPAAIAGALLALASTVPASEWSGDTDAHAVKEQLERLLGSGMRLPGSPANLALEERVAQSFAATGLEHGQIEFVAPTFLPGTTRLRTDTDEFELHPLHPSLFRPGNFTERAFSADLIDLGFGSVADLAAVRGLDLNGQLVLMDFHCGRAWERLLRFGVRGFVFIGTDRYELADAYDKVPTSEVAVPRFFVSAADGAELRRRMEGRRLAAARIHAEPSRWENRTLRNLWVLIPGTDRELQAEVAVFTAPMDANNVAPSLAFGAEAGANLHLLMELLDEFTTNPPARTVLLAAVNARTQNYLGDRLLAWYLMAPEAGIEQFRNGLSADLRLQELIVGYLQRLQFKPETRQADEDFLVELRGLSDDSIGRQITVKDPIVALSKRDVNGVKGSLLILHRENTQTRARIAELRRLLQEFADAESDNDETRAAVVELEQAEARLAGLEQEHARLTESLEEYVNVLTLFNRVGIRTRLSDLNANEESILRGYINAILDRNGSWSLKNRADLDRSERNGAIRRALGGRGISVAVSLELVWDGTQVGFSSGLPLGQPSWADRWGRNTVRIAAGMADEGLRHNLLVDTLTNVGGLPERYYVPYVSDSVLYLHRANRRPAFSYNNAYAATSRAFTPADRLDRLDTRAVAEITAFTRAFFSRLLADPILTGTAELPAPFTAGQRLWSVMTKTFKFDEFAADVLPQIPVPGSALILTPPDASPSGFTGPGIIAAYIGLTGDRAACAFIGIRETLLSSSAFAFDEDFVTVNHAVDAGETHEKLRSDVTIAPTRTLSLTEVREFVVKGRNDSSMVGAGPIYVRSYLPLSAERNSEPRRYGLTGASSGLSKKVMPASSWGPVAFYLQPHERLKLLTASKRLALNASDDDPEGAGFQTDVQLGPDFFRQSLHDMDILNRYRFGSFRGIADELVSDFLARGRTAAETARAAVAEHDHLSYLRALYEGMGAQVKAYGQIESITNDMLKAVVFYMGLLLPFCFFVQKLLFKTTRIERQMGIFCLLFIACYVLFRLIHPAFRVAKAPEAMFVAFIMGGLGMFVIYILHSRFEGEMQLLFNTMIGHAESDIGYSMVSQQAMLIGVSNMKRRRIRTALTTATIVLVTFTMLAFTSVSRRMSPTLIPYDRPASYTGVMYNWPGGQRMDESTWTAMQQLFAGEARLHTRRWLLPPSHSGQSSQFRVVHGAGRTALIEGVLGLDPAENGFLEPLPLVAGRFFEAPDADEAVVASSLAQVLQLDPERIGEQEIDFIGRRLRVVGIVDDERMGAVQDINGTSILPIKPQLAQVGGEGAIAVATDDASDESGVFYVGTAALMILPVETARRLGAAPYSLSIRFEDDAPVWPVIERLLIATGARFFISSRVPFTVGDEGRRLNDAGVYYIGSGYRTSIGGLAMLIIPLLIASTIILNTMLGSVFERKKEIAVFNAVGLNPTHIGLFFLAESFVYGILGSVGGYLIGQVLSIFLNRYGWVEDINLNFSSLSVAYVILFTITIVLLSTLYPAIVATKAAVPSGQRKWSMPSHDGRMMEVVFPFIYQPNLVAGVMGYIDDYLARFSEASTGELISERRSTVADADGVGRVRYQLTYHVALAPFDLGVTQTVVFDAAYDDSVEAYRVIMTITRDSGQDSNWVTTNKPFLERLRKLLLQWRNMKPAEHGVYNRTGAALFAEEPHGHQ